ncbi:MAG: cobalamin B12-binding domain-containing protein [Chloroflexi bacterium]|nr:cobalamin B12-binding domain-containing protein [Chloroflexota bacterium]
MAQQETLIEEFKQALLSLDRPGTRRIAERALAAGDQGHVVERLVVPAMERIGRDWENGRVALSQVYMSGRILEDLVTSILPQEDSRQKTQPRIAIAVLRDYHMLGKRIVSSVVRAAGFELIDYGRTDVEDLVGRARGDGIQVLLISTLMLGSALQVKQVKKIFDAKGCRVKVVVGGAPFRLDSELWKEVGADAVGRNASEAPAIITRMMEARS